MTIVDFSLIDIFSIVIPRGIFSAFTPDPSPLAVKCNVDGQLFDGSRDRWRGHFARPGGTQPPPIALYKLTRAIIGIGLILRMLQLRGIQISLRHPPRLGNRNSRSDSAQHGQIQSALQRFDCAASSFNCSRSLAPSIKLLSTSAKAF